MCNLAEKIKNIFQKVGKYITFSIFMSLKLILCVLYIYENINWSGQTFITRHMFPSYIIIKVNEKHIYFSDINVGFNIR